MSTSYTLEAARALEAWGGDHALRPLEAAMWRAEVDPRLRASFLSIELLDTTPDWDRLRAATEWAVEAIPRARMRIDDPGLGTPVWVPDEDFDLDYHLRRLAVPDTSMRALLDTARTIGMTPLDQRRPPWEMLLVEGLPDGRAAFISKLHHALTDGLGGMQLLRFARSRTRDHTPDKPVSTSRRAPAPTSPLLSALRSAREVPGAALRTGRQLAGFGVQALRNPVGPALDALRYADSFRRVVAHQPAPGSPLLRERSASWHFEVHDVALADMRAAARAAEASVNDVYIAALTGGFGRYHERCGVPVPTMPVAFPVSIRRSEDPLGGNRFAGARIAGPIGEPDPRERIRLIREAVLAVRNEPALAAVDIMAGPLMHLPTPLLIHVMRSIGTHNDLQASNVPGVPHETYLAGARVERLYPMGPLPGCAAMVTMVSQAGSCGIGINVDPAAVTDPALLHACVVEGFDEVLDLGR